MLTTKKIENLKKIKELNDEVQNTYPMGSNPWHAHETLDDILFDMLGDLGD